MKYILLEVKEEIVKEVWKRYKNRISMLDMAEILNMSLSSFYRILKEANNVEKSARRILVKTEPKEEIEK